MMEIDARGKLCPLPIIELAQTLRSIETGSEVVLVSDDPATAVDLVAWARMTGNEITHQEKERFTIRKLAN
ncbi:MAG: sulfurtransferase TusA family protein [Actinomycetes bacterium]